LIGRQRKRCAWQPKGLGSRRLTTSSRNRSEKTTERERRTTKETDEQNEGESLGQLRFSTTETNLKERVFSAHVFLDQGEL
jgi:hypothetical protein